jgi:hypothetical protein
MNIKVDKNGSLLLESNSPLSDEMRLRIEKRLEKKRTTLSQMKADYESGKFDNMFKKN